MLGICCKFLVSHPFPRLYHDNLSLDLIDFRVLALHKAISLLSTLLFDIIKKCYHIYHSPTCSYLHKQQPP